MNMGSTILTVLICGQKTSNLHSLDFGMTSFFNLERPYFKSMKLTYSHLLHLFPHLSLGPSLKKDYS